VFAFNLLLLSSAASPLSTFHFLRAFAELIIDSTYNSFLPYYIPQKHKITKQIPLHCQSQHETLLLAGGGGGGQII
jgi:hypothetical protein